MPMKLLIPPHPVVHLYVNLCRYIFFAIGHRPGFLSTGDRYAPGNYALLDIVAALHWIADNIRAFGGDPDEVTLFGEDYGASLVNLLLLSPVTRGKFETLFSIHTYIYIYIYIYINVSARNDWIVPDMVLITPPRTSPDRPLWVQRSRPKPHSVIGKYPQHLFVIAVGLHSEKPHRLLTGLVDTVLAHWLLSRASSLIHPSTSLTNVTTPRRSGATVTAAEPRQQQQQQQQRTVSEPVMRQGMKPKDGRARRSKSV